MSDSTQAAEKDANAMPMCGECRRPLGLFYAECPTCFANADLHGQHYDAWCAWQEAQRISAPGAV